MIDQSFFYGSHHKTYFSSQVMNLRKLIRGKGTELICTPNINARFANKYN